MNYENMLTLKSRIGNIDAGSLLDVAVGRGDFLKFVLGSFRSWKSAAGIDPDRQALEVAGSGFRQSPVVLVLGSALAMPFTDHYFDTVTLSNGLHHIEALQELFEETGRVCRPRGLIIINEMINESLSEVQESYMLYHRLSAELDNQLGRYHREPFTKKDLMGIIKSSGFQILENFVHTEIIGDAMNSQEIDAMAERLKSKVALLHGSDHYYFYENKVREIICRFKKSGIHRPRHITFILKPL